MFTKKYTTGHVSRWPHLIPMAFFAAAIYLCFQPSSGPANSTPQGQAASVGKTTLVGNPIRDARLGQRVLGRNPLREQVDESLPEPDAETWRKITLRMTKDDGHRLDIELLRPLFWLELHEAEPGATISLDLPEMGAQGNAEVVAVEPCPEIEPDDGRGRPIVTGRFIHQSADVIDLHLDGLGKPIGCTANHPFWSEDRQEFVEAAELDTGEHVQTRLHGPIRVTRIAPRPGKHPVYNLEIHGEHVYEVSHLGVLVHNTYFKRIRYRGNDLAKRAWNYRKALTNPQTGRNGAVIEYTSLSGRKLTKTMLSDGKHTERLLVESLPGYVRKEPGRITRIYSELRPCGPDYHNCDAFLRLAAPKATVTYSMPYWTKAERAVAIRDLQKLVRQLLAKGL